MYKIKLKTFTLKIKEPNISDAGKIKNSEEVYTIAKKIYAELDDLQEHFTVLFLNNDNNITGYKTLFSGGQTYSTVDCKIIFRSALLMGAVSIICVHNHPSGKLEVSQNDIHITNQIKQAGNIIEVKLLDHLIITTAGYMSFADEGRI